MYKEFLEDISTIKQLENNLENDSFIYKIKREINNLQNKLEEYKKPFEDRIDKLDEKVKIFIRNRVKLLNKNKYVSCVSCYNDFSYEINNDTILISEEDYWHGETEYYEDEIPLKFFTCSDEECLVLIKRMQDEKELIKLRIEKEELLRKLKELEDYEKETGIKVREIMSR